MEPKLTRAEIVPSIYTRRENPETQNKGRLAPYNTTYRQLLIGSPCLSAQPQMSER